MTKTTKQTSKAAVAARYEAAKARFHGLEDRGVRGRELARAWDEYTAAKEAHYVAQGWPLPL